jgi:uncharacterized protein DUF4326
MSEGIMPYTSSPRRIQRQRRKGWRLPATARSVTRPGRWGNPFAIGKDGNRAQVLHRFETYARARLAQEPGWLDPLRGKDLACWCHEGDACHADMLLQLANALPIDTRPAERRVRGHRRDLPR